MNIGLLRPRKANPIGEINNFVQPSNKIYYHQYQKINSHNITKIYKFRQIGGVQYPKEVARQRHGKCPVMDGVE